MVGRPSSYTEELADEFCRRIAEGTSMKRVCEMDDMPCMATIYKWNREVDAFAKKYAKAREDQTQAFIEDIVEIADDGRNDWMEKNDPENPGYRFNGEHVQRSKLRIETRKWIAQKMLPRIYGDKLQIGGAADLPPIQTESKLNVSGLTLEELDALQKAIIKTLETRDGD